MSKKKPVDPPPPQPNYRYPKFSPQFLDDLAWWYKNDRCKIDKIFGLVTDTILHPFLGLGKPEPLKHLGADVWSRRIDLENRLVYKVLHEHIDFLQARYHY
ncbi:MAG: Txe/YoeB family addiction module toxin [Chroococcidiopsidaceae cyanobacterium CP_BM_ER_R8_30]|nr:Txe/YoeB family addiction module toxin [Chroococcidiopsidaceae cyanobacterium CP_BM_ER_R8_30]